MLFCPLHRLVSEGPEEWRGAWFISCFVCVCSGSDQVSWHWPLLPIRVLRKACLFAIWACGTKETMSAVSAVSVRTGRENRGFELKGCGRHQGPYLLRLHEHPLPETQMSLRPPPWDGTDGSGWNAVTSLKVCAHVFD